MKIKPIYIITFFLGILVCYFLTNNNIEGLCIYDENNTVGGSCSDSAINNVDDCKKDNQNWGGGLCTKGSEIIDDVEDANACSEKNNSWLIDNSVFSKIGGLDYSSLTDDNECIEKGGLIGCEAPDLNTIGDNIMFNTAGCIPGKPGNKCKVMCKSDFIPDESKMLTISSTDKQEIIRNGAFNGIGMDIECKKDEITNTNIYKLKDDTKFPSKKFSCCKETESGSGICEGEEEGNITETPNTNVTEPNTQAVPVPPPPPPSQPGEGESKGESKEEPKEEESSVVRNIVIVIVIVLAIGGIYLFYARKKMKWPFKSSPPELIQDVPSGTPMDDVGKGVAPEP